MIAANYNYWIAIVLMLVGLYIVIAHGNLIKKLIGLNIFQTSVFIFFITLGKIDGATAPIHLKNAPDTVYSNPLPHVLILTAIVVGVAVTALGLALVVRIREAYGSIEEDDILDKQEAFRRLDPLAPDISVAEEDVLFTKPPHNGEQR